ncbi:large ribosomal subunit protein bL36m [Neocloeon triangulifer]|uniref:large ribosomal subunit protein bL36m n=1 Tax=Neocloeon triangulifer TaxID=2078957 RepID=UPI00286F4F69|nr:large ribosomal subunit protein bL36m [Neocloeon triangulifer]
MNLARNLASCLLPRAAGLLANVGLRPQLRAVHLLAQIRLPVGEKILLKAPCATLLAVPNCGMKVKGLLKRRCKDCYFVYRDSRKYVMCKAHPRHKQAAFAPREKYTWILSPGPMQSKQRPW